ncbi:uncharacterized protein BYT42DRAFT_566380 [Radiomyces spectabilis]|uniref:uncharacterized protein n=1 Tax=Radiomyces spectabilis TaxID=64574 RepID=UPI00221E84F7|nr:uncharacterized protein BYT42DRAFT_566380 [Radiomyces spectabilis]KAI8381395.1 hypothetical protein BYT42DRAFT_566380 [Radiomyces spectabilis]
MSQPRHVAVTMPSVKPTMGSAEWYRIRRENHKQVERRRRELINKGINELAQLVPGCEKNKSGILMRTIQYIYELKEDKAKAVDKWQQEKLLRDQTMTLVEQLRQENEELRAKLKTPTTNKLKS